MGIPQKLKELMTVRGLTQVKLADAVDVSQPTVSGWLNGTKGIDRSNAEKLAQFFETSTLYFLDNESTSKGKRQVPLFEWVQAGTWTDFCQKSDELKYIDLPDGISEKCFAVKVRGNSMSRTSGTSICEGSIVFCKPICGIINPEELNHKVVIAQYRDSATLKEFIYDNPCYLAPWNPDRTLYPNLPVSDDVRIVGVVVASQLFL